LKIKNPIHTNKETGFCQFCFKKSFKSFLFEAGSMKRIEILLYWVMVLSDGSADKKTKAVKLNWM